MPRNAQPILADWFNDFIIQSARHYVLDADVTMPVKETLAGANRFVFPKRTTEMAEDAVKIPRKLAPFLTLPDKWTWLEFVDPDEGILLNARDDLRYAHCIYVVRDRVLSGPLARSQHDAKRRIVTTVSCQLDLAKGGFQLEQDPSALPERFQRRFMGAITLLGAPDLLERRQVQHSNKWNEQRAAKGRLQHLDHDVIELHLTHYEKDQEQAWAATAHERRDAGEAPKYHKRLHFVRAHIRITHQGKVSKVSPHYRGDPNLGIAPRTHIVRP